MTWSYTETGRHDIDKDISNSRRNANMVIKCVNARITIRNVRTSSDQSTGDENDEIYCLRLHQLNGHLIAGVS